MAQRPKIDASEAIEDLQVILNLANPDLFKLKDIKSRQVFERKPSTIEQRRSFFLKEKSKRQKYFENATFEKYTIIHIDQNESYPVKNMDKNTAQTMKTDDSQ